MTRTMKAVARTLFAALFCLMPISEATAQYPFGKNKIQYTPKEWKVIETSHFEIFYYPDETAIAEFIAGKSEDVYDEYSVFFGLELDRKIPVVLYGTHHDFKETNIIPYMISEGTGGFTEFIKGRVALPFDGSYSRLVRVYRHEITHAFMLEKLRSVMNSHRRYTYNHPPLWFTEGLAEYLGQMGQDSEAHMFVRDAVITGKLYSLMELWRIYGTYMMYKEGESAIHFIATNFGEDAIRVILENWWKSDKFDVVLRRSIGLGVKDLDRNWQDHLKRKYYPAILTRRQIQEVGEMVSAGEISFEVHPVCYRDRTGRERVVGIGFGLGSIDIVEFVERRDQLPSGQQNKHPWKKETLIKGGRSTRFESIPLMRSRTSMKGDTLLFVAKSGEKDAIYLYGTEERKVLRRITYNEARVLSSPDLSRDGRYLVFSAIDRHGRADLYLYDLLDESFERLTEDVYEDVQPAWHPSEHSIVFSSDRCARGLEGKSALYVLDLDKREISPLTGGEYRDTDPRWFPDGGGLLFTSDRNGVFDVFLLQDDEIVQQTNIIGGAFHAWPCGSGEEFLVAAYNKSLYRIYRMPVRKAPVRVAQVPLSNIGVSWKLGSLDSVSDVEKKEYRLKMGIDFIGATFALDPDFGSIGNGAQLFLTDLLGNHQVIILAGSATDDFDDFWRYLNAAVTYVNLTSRINYYVGAFHLAGYLGSIYDVLRFERRYGGVVGIRYPLSKFMRFDFSTVVKGMERNDEIAFTGEYEGRSWLISNYFSFTHDNIVWYIGGPISGQRLNIACGITNNPSGSSYESTTLHIDVRNYLNLSRRIVFAQRFVSRNSWGSDLQLFYLGGSWDLRGYNFRQFSGKRILLINNELRFPLVDRLLMGFPFGYIDFPMFRGSLFVDAARVQGYIYDTGWIGSLGTGIEMNLGYLPVIRLNFSRQTDFETLDRDVHVDFFLGFNF
jgi:hypothetical protein